MLDSFKVLNLADGSTFENKEHEITLEDEVSLNSEEIKELEKILSTSIGNLDELKEVLLQLDAASNKKGIHLVKDIIAKQIETKQLIVNYNQIINSVIDFKNNTIFGKNNYAKALQDELEALVFNFLIISATYLREDDDIDQEEIRTVEILCESIENFLFQIDRAKVCLEYGKDPRTCIITEDSYVTIEIEENGEESQIVLANNLNETENNEEISEEEMLEILENARQINIPKYLTEYLVNLDIDLKLFIEELLPIFPYNGFHYNIVKEYDSMFIMFEELNSKILESLNMDKENVDWNQTIYKISKEYFFKEEDFLSEQFTNLEQYVIDNIKEIDERFTKILENIDLFLSLYFIQTVKGLLKSSDSPN